MSGRAGPERITIELKRNGLVLREEWKFTDPTERVFCENDLPAFLWWLGEAVQTSFFSKEFDTQVLIREEASAEREGVRRIYSTRIITLWPTR